MSMPADLPPMDDLAFPLGARLDDLLDCIQRLKDRLHEQAGSRALLLRAEVAAAEHLSRDGYLPETALRRSIKAATVDEQCAVWQVDALVAGEQAMYRALCMALEVDLTMTLHAGERNT